jgi:DNA-binding NtrC family response regulator
MANILLVDDSLSILHILEQWLVAAGHRVTVRNSGLHIGRLLRTTRLDLVITDIYMPDVDGMQLLFLLRKDHPKLPCIAMSSAEGDFNLLGAAKQLGAVAALRKPFTKDVLLDAVAAILAPKPGSTSVSTAPCT